MKGMCMAENEAYEKAQVCKGYLSGLRSAQFQPAYMRRDALVHIRNFDSHQIKAS